MSPLYLLFDANAHAKGNNHETVLLCLSTVSDPIGNLSCSGLSWDSIFLSWEVPANPNGQIVYYEITVGIGLEFFEYQSPSTEHVVTGLLPDNWYTLTVSAVNSAGPGDKVNCSASTLSESGM